MGLRARWWKIQIRTTLRAVGETWCTIHWFWVVALIVYLWHLTATGHVLLPLALSWMLAYFIVNTWPRRWLLDLACAFGLLVTAVNFVLAHQH